MISRMGPVRMGSRGMLVLMGFVAGMVFAMSCGGGGSAVEGEAGDTSGIVVHRLSIHGPIEVGASQSRVVGGFLFTPTQDPHMPLHVAGEVDVPSPGGGSLTVELRLAEDGEALASGTAAVPMGAGQARVVVPVQHLPAVAGPRSGATYRVRVLYTSAAEPVGLLSVTGELGDYEGVTVDEPTAIGMIDPLTADADGDGYSLADGDCDDDNMAVHPGATETRNGVDDDCDGLVDFPGDSCSNTIVLDNFGVENVVSGDLATRIDTFHLPAGSCSSPAAIGIGGKDVVLAYDNLQEVTWDFQLRADGLSIDLAFYICTDCNDVGGSCVAYVNGQTDADAEATAGGEVLSGFRFPGYGTYYIVIDVAGDPYGFSDSSVAYTLEMTAR